MSPSHTAFHSVHDRIRHRQDGPQQRLRRHRAQHYQVLLVLSGSDLKIDKDREEVTRWIVFEGTYDSDLGSDLPLKEQAEFTVLNLKKVK